MRLPFPLILPALLVSACSSIVPGTAAQVQAASPLEVDPAGIAVAIDLPAGLRVPPGSAKLQLSVTRTDTGTTRALDLTLLAQPGTAELPGVVYTIAPPDVGRMRALQAEVAGWKAEVPVPETNGSFSLGLGGCAVGAGPARDATGSAALRLKTDGPFLPLIRAARLRDVLGPAVFDAIGPCAGPG